MNVQTASRLAILRKKYGLSQEELAERVGVSRQAVSKWERAESSPDTNNLIALARIYDLKVDDMLNGNFANDDNPAPVQENRQFNWASFPYPIVVVIFFFLFMFDIIPVPFPAWLVFLTIPLWGFFFTKGHEEEDEKRKEEARKTKRKQKQGDDWMNE